MFTRIWGWHSREFVTMTQIHVHLKVDMSNDIKGVYCTLKSFVVSISNSWRLINCLSYFNYKFWIVVYQNSSIFSQIVIQMVNRQPFGIQNNRLKGNVFETPWSISMCGKFWYIEMFPNKRRTEVLGFAGTLCAFFEKLIHYGKCSDYFHCAFTLKFFFARKL